MVDRADLIDEEYKFDDSSIISETDLEGNIVYVNRSFCELSGYNKEELIGQKHSMFKHPDMPSAIFKEMWETITEDKEWSGLIKNVRKNGTYYWAHTFIKPSYKNNEKVGYIAVRNSAAPMSIEEAIKKYKILD